MYRQINGSEEKLIEFIGNVDDAFPINDQKQFSNIGVYIYMHFFILFNEIIRFGQIHNGK